jgi:hypothetical protein
MITVDNILHGKAYSPLTWAQVLNQAARLAIIEHQHLVAVKPGVEIETGVVQELGRRAGNGYILTPTVIDPKNTRLELTHRLAAGFPDMKYAMGTHDPGQGMEALVCFDHGVIAAPWEALADVGAFDPGYIEYLCICDWTVRARWQGYTVHLAHDLTVTALNPPPFTAVYRDREAQMAILDRAHFERKWGGAVLKNVME